MATIREKKSGVWEVRVFTGRDPRGKPTQISRTVRGGKRDAQRLAVQLEGGPGRATAAGRTVGDVLDAWVEHNTDTWAPSSARDQRSRVKAIKLDDALPRMPVAWLSVADIERWHARLRAAWASRTPASRTSTVRCAPPWPRPSGGAGLAIRTSPRWRSCGRSVRRSARRCRPTTSVR